MTYDEYKARAEAKWEEYSVNVEYWEAKLPENSQEARREQYYTIRQRVYEAKQRRKRAMESLDIMHERSLAYKQGAAY